MVSSVSKLHTYDEKNNRKRRPMLQLAGGMARNSAKPYRGMMLLRGILFLLAVSGTFAKNDTAGKKGLNIVAILEPPYVIKDAQTGKFKGLMIDVLDAAGIQIDHIDTPTHDQYGGKHPDNPGEFSGVIGHLIDGKYDLAVAPFSIRSARAKVVTFTQPVLHAGYMVLYKTPKEYSPKVEIMSTLLKPFSPVVWFLLLVMCLVASIVLYVIRRYSPYEDYINNPSIQRADHDLASMSWSGGFMYLLGCLFGRNCTATPLSASGRMLTAVWWLFSLMTVGAYIAGLVVVLFKTNPHFRTLPFNSVEEMLATTDVKVLGVKNGATYNYMAGHKGFYERKIYEYWKANWDTTMVDSLDIALKMMMEGDGKYAIFMDEAQADYLATQEPCDKMVIGEPVGDLTVGFACAKGEQTCDDINHVILDLQESGKLEQLREKWFWSGCHMSSEVYYNGHPFVDTFGLGTSGLFVSASGMTIHRFSVAFIILLIGVFLSLAILIVEMFYARRKGNMIHHRLKHNGRNNEDARGIQQGDGFDSVPEA